MDLPDLNLKEEDISEPFPTLPEKRKSEEKTNSESETKKVRKEKKQDIVVIDIDESDEEVSYQIFVNVRIENTLF